MLAVGTHVVNGYTCFFIFCILDCELILWLALYN